MSEACEGLHDEPVAATGRFEVFAVDGGSWGVFDYCDECAAKDRANGFTLKPAPAKEET